MARSAQTARKPKANKNINSEENKTNAEQIETKQEKQRKRAEQKQKKADKLLILFTVQNVQDKWIFKLFNKSKQLYKILIAEKECICSCSEKKSNESACRHLQYILVNVAKCQLAFQQILQKTIISQATFSNLDKILKQTLSSRLKQPKKIEIKQKVCYICMLLMDSQQGPSIKDCCSCNKKFHIACAKLWKFLKVKDCPLCHKTLFEETEQKKEKKQQDSCDQV